MQHLGLSRKVSDKSKKKSAIDQFDQLNLLVLKAIEYYYDYKNKIGFMNTPGASIDHVLQEATHFFKESSIFASYYSFESLINYDRVTDDQVYIFMLKYDYYSLKENSDPKKWKSYKKEEKVIGTLYDVPKKFFDGIQTIEEAIYAIVELMRPIFEDAIRKSNEEFGRPVFTKLEPL